MQVYNIYIKLEYLQEYNESNKKVERNTEEGSEDTVSIGPTYGHPHRSLETFRSYQLNTKFEYLLDQCQKLYFLVKHDRIFTPIIQIQIKNLSLLIHRKVSYFYGLEDIKEIFEDCPESKKKLCNALKLMNECFNKYLIDEHDIIVLMTQLVTII